jgi:hypothetical protein
MPDSLRESLEASFDEHAPPDTGDTPAPAAPPAPAPAPAPAPGDEPPAGDEPTAASKQRDERGRFAREKSDNTPAPVASGQQQPLPLGEPPPVDQFAKAPQSWKPGAREAWANIPADVRAEVYRRERESERLASEHAQSRQVSSYVQRLQQQFAPALHAEGVDALTASANLMQLASRLRYGTPVEKAQLAAQIVTNYGVDVVALAAALDGQQVAGQRNPQQAMTYQDPRVDQLLGQLQQAQTERATQVQQRAVSDVESFGENKEFFDDVREDMGDLMELMAKRGVDMTLEQAYERACAMNPEIAKVVAARGAARNAGNGNSSIQRARAAASSVRGTPNQVSTPAPTDLRGAIEAAIEQVGGR